MKKLGEDILFDILSRLPVRSLIQYKCINKKWFSLISDPQFARANLKRSLQEIPSLSCYRLLLASYPVNSVNYEALLVEEANEEVDATANIIELDYPVKVPEDLERSSSLVGSCDGLVCLLRDDDDVISLILWNPTTREYRVLPKPGINVSSEGDFFYGLGYDSFSDDYKLLVGECDGSTTAIVEIFALKTNSWRRLKGCHGSLHCHGKVCEEGTYCHGSLHWLSATTNNDSEEANESKIISFDMSEERFHETITLPCLDPEGLGIVEDRLFIYNGVENSLQFEAWIMKEYGIGSSWSKEFSCSTKSFPTNKYWTRLITFTRDKKIVFDLCGWELCLYDPEQSTYRSFELRND